MNGYPRQQFELRVVGLEREHGVLLHARRLVNHEIEQRVFGAELPEQGDLVDARLIRNAAGGRSAPAVEGVHPGGGVEDSLAMVVVHGAMIMQVLTVSQAGTCLRHARAAPTCTSEGPALLWRGGGVVTCFSMSLPPFAVAP